MIPFTKKFRKCKLVYSDRSRSVIVWGLRRREKAKRVEKGRERFQRGRNKLLRVMDMFTMLIVVMAVQVNVYVITYQTVYLYIYIYVYMIACQLCLSNEKKKRHCPLLFLVLWQRIRPSGVQRKVKFGLIFRFHNTNFHLIGL